MTKPNPNVTAPDRMPDDATVVVLGGQTLYMMRVATWKSVCDALYDINTDASHRVGSALEMRLFLARSSYDPAPKAVAMWLTNAERAEVDAALVAIGTPSPAVGRELMARVWVDLNRASESLTELLSAATTHTMYNHVHDIRTTINSIINRLAAGT